MRRIQNKLKQQIILWVCCFSFLLTNAQPQSLSENAEISVLTCGTGAEVYTLFGHTALRVKDDTQSLDVVYNWGIFDFRTPNFLAKFIKGDLLYYLGVERFDDFLYNYTAEDREVIEQKLNLTYNQKIAIWEEINRQLKSEERYYHYQFIQNNCTTKVVDVLNKVLEDPLKTDFPSNNHSYRFILNEGLSNHYFEKLGINLLFGYKTNKQSDLMFLPIKLKDGVTFDGAILKSETKLNHVPEIATTKSLNSIYTLWIIVVIIGLGCLNKKVRFLYFAVTALFGLFLLAVSLYSNHTELQWNVLVLFFNPLFVIALLIKSNKVFYIAAVLSVLSLLLIGFELLMIVSPLIILHFIYVMVCFLLTKRAVNLQP
ncbi:MAG TPA: DUF4105 domain-containing protein [Flavobacterium sp.]|nr:DUF4105 domain-containing protein [Flavobacterium sp.]